MTYSRNCMCITFSHLYIKLGYLHITFYNFSIYLSELLFYRLSNMYIIGLFIVFIFGMIHFNYLALKFTFNYVFSY